MGKGSLARLGEERERGASTRVPPPAPGPTSELRLDRVRVRSAVGGRGHCSVEAFSGHLLCPRAPAETGVGADRAARAPVCLYVTVCVRGPRRVRVYVCASGHETVVCIFRVPLTLAWLRCVRVYKCVCIGSAPVAVLVRGHVYSLGVCQPGT